jgi:hypothetical protein
LKVITHTPPNMLILSDSQLVGTTFQGKIDGECDLGVSVMINLNGKQLRGFLFTDAREYLFQLELDKSLTVNESIPSPSFVDEQTEDVTSQKKKRKYVKSGLYRKNKDGTFVHSNAERNVKNTKQQLSMCINKYVIDY